MSVIVVKGSNTSRQLTRYPHWRGQRNQFRQHRQPELNHDQRNDLLVGFVKTYGVEDFTAGLGFTLQSGQPCLNLTAETGAAATPAVMTRPLQQAYMQLAIRDWSGNQQSEPDDVILDRVHGDRREPLANTVERCQARDAPASRKSERLPLLVQ